MYKLLKYDDFTSCNFLKISTLRADFHESGLLKKHALFYLSQYSNLRVSFCYCFIVIKYLLVVDRGLKGDSEGRGPTNPQPTPYQPPINPLSTPNENRTIVKQNHNNLNRK